jgi:hypothetical protein
LFCPLGIGVGIHCSTSMVAEVDENPVLARPLTMIVALRGVVASVFALLGATVKLLLPVLVTAQFEDEALEMSNSHATL